MKRIALLVFLFAFTACNNLPTPDLVLQNVNVIDVKSGEVQRNQDVSILGNRIVDIAPHTSSRSYQSAVQIDASEKYLIPGLWDMHAHATWPWRIEKFYPAFVANGVTGIRDMWGDLEVARHAKIEIAAGKLVGPRIVVAGSMVDGSPPRFSRSVSVSTITEAEAAVDSLQKAGSDFIKVQSRLSRDAYFAIMEKAKQKGMIVAGHVPYSVSAAEASDAGQKSMEHLYGILEGCSPDEMTIKKAWQEISLSPDNERRRTFQKKILESFSEKRCRTLAQRFVQNGTWQVPTLILLKGYAFPEKWESISEDPRINILHPQNRSWWNIDNNSIVNTRSPADWEMQQRVFYKNLELVNILNQEGVKILAGTDTANPTVFPGFSLHDELSLLVEAGLTPAEALRAATLNPAKYLGTLDSLGTVEKGKIADLVLLNANPLENIGNTRLIEAVIVNGNLLNRSTLDETLATIQKAPDK